MAIKPTRQIFHKELNMVSLRAGEAGGILSYIASSGVPVVGYLEDITSAEVYPLGIQLHNVEIMDEGFMYNPWVDRGVRRVSKPNEPVAFSAHCIVETNFIHPNANPDSSKKAYLAPSGLITDDASLGGPQIGYFMSSIEQKPSVITVFGGGWIRTDYMKKTGDSLFEVQQPQIEKVLLATSGYVKIRIKI